MKKAEEGHPEPWVAALIQQWSQPDKEDLPPTWWNHPRQITAIAGHFDAPTRSDNDPTGRIAQMALFTVLVSAIYRANVRGILVIPSQIRANRFSGTNPRQPALVADSQAFFGLLVKSSG